MMKNLLNKVPVQTHIAVLATALFTSLFIELFVEKYHAFYGMAATGFLSAHYSLEFLCRLACLFIVATAICYLVSLNAQKIGDFLFKWRLALGAVVVLLAVLFEASGSSLAIVGTHFGYPVDSSSTLGIPRSIRSDEFSVFTSFALSQEHNNYQPVSEIIRAASTDVTMVYAQSSFSLATLFRPFLWGYLLLGSAKGLAFFWAARFVVLFLVSFEFGRIYTKDNRLLALLHAILIACAPLVQWWFAVNGLVEMLVFGQLACVFLAKYLVQSSAKVRVFLLLGIAYSAVAYLFTLYPAWQIPLFYVFLACAVWIVLERRKEHCLRRSIDIPAIFAALALVVLMAYLIISSSWETIQATMNTAYPGRRLETGGGASVHLLGWMTSLFLPFAAPSLLNECEVSSMIGLFPLGVLLGAASLFIKRDKLSIVLLVATVFLSVFCFIGFPEFLAKATLLSQVTSGRGLLGIYLLNSLLLVRALALFIESKALSQKGAGEALLEHEANLGRAKVTSLLRQKKSLLLIAVPLALFGFLLGIEVYLGLFGFENKMLLMAGIIFTAIALMLLLFDYKKGEFCGFAGFIGAVCVALSLMVNPVQLGINTLTQLPPLELVSAVVEENPEAVWVHEGDGFIPANALLSVGARTLNCTNAYPALERWSKLDPTGEYRDIYNRYAHIDICFTNAATSFELLFADNFRLNLSYSDVELLGFEYVLTNNNLAMSNNDLVSFELIEAVDGWNVYKVIAT